MSLTHTWKVNSLDYDTETMRVTHVHYTVESSDETINNMSYGSVVLTGEATIPYELITEALAISWCKRELGDEEVSRIEQRNQDEITGQNVSSSGTPWE